MLVLNPWGKFTWKGQYSFEDRDSWTEELKAALGYNFLKDQENGLFWIEFETVSEVFEIIEMNWNPDMLKYSITKFGLWRAGDMVDGFEDISKSPQYKLQFAKDIKRSTNVYLWVVLSRFLIDDNEDFSEFASKEKEYISVHLGKSIRASFPSSLSH